MKSNMACKVVCIRRILCLVLALLNTARTGKWWISESEEVLGRSSVAFLTVKAGEIAESLKSLCRKHKDLSLDTQNPEHVGMAV